MKRLNIFYFLIAIFLFSSVGVIYGNESIVTYRIDYFEAKMLLKEILTEFDEKFQKINYESERTRVVSKIETIIDKIESYLESGQKNAQANYDLGMTYFLAKRMEIVNDFERSNSYYKEAIRINPNYEEARVLLARNFMEEKQYVEALEQSIYMYENNMRGDALKMVAVAKIHLQRFEEAKKDLKEYLKTNRQDRSVRALIYAIDNGKIKDRLEAFRSEKVK